MTNPLPIIPITKPVNGTITLPGSKSITNRALILAALCNGTITLTGALFSRDTRIMIAALRELGFAIHDDESSHTITIAGQGGKIPRAKAKIFIGNAGTAARFLTAMLALHPSGEYELDGDPAMRARPMGGLLRALVAQGATVTAPDGTNTESFPFILQTRGLRGGEIAVDATASSQILSALLMVAPLATAPASIRLVGQTVSEPFVEMTLRLCAAFGNPAKRKNTNLYTFYNKTSYIWPKENYEIEPDATAASYFFALPMVAPAKISISGLSLDGLQGDIAFINVLKTLGLPMRQHTNDTTWEIDPPTASLPGGSFDFNAISDTFLTLAALAPLLTAPLTIRGIAHARKQETDRLLAMATELEKLGQRIEPSVTELRADTSIGTFTIHPDREAMRRISATAPVRIHTYEDHRVAMSFGILGTHDLHGDGRPWLAIEDPACCGKTFPDFFTVLETITSLH